MGGIASEEVYVWQEVGYCRGIDLVGVWYGSVTSFEALMV